MGTLLKLWDWIERAFSFSATWAALMSAITGALAFASHFPPLGIGLAVLDAAIAGCFVVPAYKNLREALTKSPIRLSLGAHYGDDGDQTGYWPYRIHIFNSGTTTLKNLAASYSWHSKSQSAGNSVSLSNHFSEQLKGKTLNARTGEDVTVLTDQDIDHMEHYAEEAYSSFDVFVRVEAEDVLPTYLKMHFERSDDAGPDWNVSVL